QLFLKRSQPLLEKLSTELNAFIDQESTILDQRRGEIFGKNPQSNIAVWGAVVFGFVFFVGVCVNAPPGVARPARSLAPGPGPVHQLREAAGQLLAGQAPRLSPSGPTEIAQLIVHFNHMAITLSERTSTLQIQEERYRSYVLGSAHILWTTNADGAVAGDLPAWRGYTGQTEEEIQ